MLRVERFPVTLSQRRPRAKRHALRVGISHPELLNQRPGLACLAEAVRARLPIPSTSPPQEPCCFPKVARSNFSQIEPQYLPQRPAHRRARCQTKTKRLNAHPIQGVLLYNALHLMQPCTAPPPHMRLCVLPCQTAPARDWRTRPAARPPHRQLAVPQHARNALWAVVRRRMPPPVPRPPVHSARSPQKAAARCCASATRLREPPYLVAPVQMSRRSLAAADGSSQLALC